MVDSGRFLSTTCSTAGLGGAVDVQGESETRGPTLRGKTCYSTVFISFLPHFLEKLRVAGDYFLFYSFSFGGPELS